ncbi:MAG: tRNA 2-thiocytidine(32) synthetase TtcA [Deltaproteobacteria bacterium]|nr:MAG: tRNA 2-thiocytidine(32) synthetase TtcA [Deltaproteobacteria bacterium]
MAILNDRYLLDRNKKYFRLNKLVGKAIVKYDLIKDGDKILVGVSGGKDSITMMASLNDRVEWAPVGYKLVFVYIDPGFDGGFSSELKSFCNKNSIDIHIEYTDFGVYAHGSENLKKSPCFICSWNRRKRLFDLAEKFGCNKIALGHTKDDLIATLFINMCYRGHMSTMVPCQDFFNGRFKIIRPLCLVDEKDIKSFIKTSGLPVFKNICPSSGNSKRDEIKIFLKTLYTNNKRIKENIFRSMSNIDTDYLL